MRRIKVAQIGIGHDHCDVFCSLTDQPEVFDVAGYYIPECEQGRFNHFLKHFEGYPQLALEQILNDPEIEAVVIETEEENLVKYAFMAAQAGKHIHMDKPGGFKMADFEALIDLVRQKNLVLHLGYMYRYNPIVSDVIQRVKEGELGDILSVDAQMNTYLTPQKREWMNTLPGGMTFWLGCHLMDLLLQLQGEPKNIVSFCGSTGADGVEARDFSMHVFQYDQGASVLKTCAREHGGFNRRQLTVCGTLGTIEIKPLEVRADDKHQHVDAVEYWPAQSGKGTITRHSDLFTRYGKMMERFAAMARGEIQNPYTYDYEMRLYRLVMKCCEME
jgi:predicted dehydrogenase